MIPLKQSIYNLFQIYHIQLLAMIFWQGEERAAILYVESGMAEIFSFFYTPRG